MIGPDRESLERLVRQALAEDLGDRGDITSLATIDLSESLDGVFVPRSDGTICGLFAVAVVTELSSNSLKFEPLVEDGMRVKAGDAIAAITGPAVDVLAIERVCLNLLGHLSGIATATARWVDVLEGSTTKVRDTRKTTPGLRDLEKWAVRCGGGVNHRQGLHDAVLIKDNHLAAAGGVTAALDRATNAWSGSSVVVQLEVDDLAQLDEALAHHWFRDALPDGRAQILLDNFATDDMAEAVRRTRAAAPNVLLEASGGLRLENAAEVAATGVDFVAVGALTHSSPALDIGLDAH